MNRKILIQFVVWYISYLFLVSIAFNAYISGKTFVDIPVVLAEIFIIAYVIAKIRHSKEIKQSYYAIGAVVSGLLKLGVLFYSVKLLEIKATVTVINEVIPVVTVFVVFASLFSLLDKTKHKRKKIVISWILIFILISISSITINGIAYIIDMLLISYFWQ